MQDLELLNNGTIYFKRRDENTFNVIPGSSVLLGLFDPKLSLSDYQFDGNVMETFLKLLTENFGYSRKLLCNPSVRFEHPNTYTGESETTFLVKSQTTDKEYKVTLRNLAKREDDMATKLKSLRNLKHDCGCERGHETDILCSIPEGAARAWGISSEEYRQSFLEKSKIYGEKICKHEARALSFMDYPLFDRIRFHERVLPAVIKDMIHQEVSRQEDMDVIVRHHWAEMGWKDVLHYIRQLHTLEASIVDIQSKIS